MTRTDRGFVALAAIVLMAVFLLAGCAQPLATSTQVIDRPVIVHCTPELPRECRDQYAVDVLQQGADPVQQNRAIRAELEQRAACEVKLRAAIKGCSK